MIRILYHVGYIPVFLENMGVQISIYIHISSKDTFWLEFLRGCS